MNRDVTGLNWDALVLAGALPRHEARALLEHASGRPREWLIAHGDEPAPPTAAALFEALAARRRAGEPLAYLLGWREFHGLRFTVTPDVLIPRPETELLVDEAAERAAPGARVIDLGTGSGAIAVALARLRPDLRITATDRSAAALAVARENARRLLTGGAEPRWLCGDWWQAAPPGECFDLIVANPPYIADGDPHLSLGDLPHEPRSALAAGADGLHDLRRIVDGARTRLAADGWLLLEHGYDQRDAVQALLRDAGWPAPTTLADAAGQPRMTLIRQDPDPRSPSH
ncbi:MAG: peptide chain release factor N(5)-glutamine methyltransferase [Burkholderiaceae bacterium]